LVYLSLRLLEKKKGTISQGRFQQRGFGRDFRKPKRDSTTPTQLKWGQKPGTPILGRLRKFLNSEILVGEGGKLPDTL